MKKPSLIDSEPPLLVTPPAPPDAIRLLVDLIFASIEAGTAIPC
jgi:hypothetical protein